MEISVFDWSRKNHQMSFQILYCVLVRSSRTPNRTMHGKKDWEWFKSSPEYRNFDRIGGEPMDFEWNIFPRFNTLQLSDEVKSLLLKLGETPENFTGRIIFMSMFNDISCGSRDNEKMHVKCQSRFSESFIGPGSEEKWYSISEDSPQGEWTIWRKGCYWNSQKADIQFSVLQVHCPRIKGQNKTTKTRFCQLIHKNYTYW